MDDFPIKFKFVEGIAVVTVEAVLDRQTMDLLVAAVSKLVDRKRYRIVIELRRPGDAATWMLGAGLFWAEYNPDVYGNLRIVLVSDDYRFIHDHETMRLDRFFPLKDSVPEAITSLLGREE